MAAAERQLAAANAQIEVAKSAFFPAISLTGTAGYARADIASLPKPHSRIWSIGPSLDLPFFQGGRNRAALARNRAVFDENLADYRQQVLIAFGDDQNELTAVRWLDEQARAPSPAPGGRKTSPRSAMTRGMSAISRWSTPSARPSRLNVSTPS